METRRWTNPSHPQTLQIAVFLLYLNAVFGLLFGEPLRLFGLLLGLVVVVAYAAGGFGVANDQNWGYGVALAVAVIVVAVSLVRFRLDFGLILDLMFDVVLLALLLHPQSRDYQRIWFS